MGQEQSSANEQEIQAINQQKFAKRKSTMQNIANKLFIDPIEMNSMSTFLEKNGYTINDLELGKGGSGIVFSGETAKKEAIAIKIVKCQKRGQAEGIIKEFNLLKTIKSNNVVQAIDLLQFESQNVNILITVMERCEYNLTSYLRQIRGQLEKHQLQEKVYEICIHLIKGLNDIHKANILHLDIKPSNIMMGRDKQWKFIDMGISVLLQEQHFINNCGMTQLYSSPEQYNSFMQTTIKTAPGVTKSSDIYSLGLVFTEITGVILDKKLIMQEKLNPEGVFDQQLNPQFSQFNNNIILKMIQYSPERRVTTEYIERQLSTLLFEAQYNASIQNKSTMSSLQYISQQQKSQTNLDNLSKSQTFNDLSQRSNNKGQDVDFRAASSRVSNLQSSQVSPSTTTTTTNYGTNHILKQQNTQSALQRTSFRCEHIFNQNASQTPSNQKIESRQSEFYPSNMNRSLQNNSTLYNNNPSNYRFSTVIAQQY